MHEALSTVLVERHALLAWLVGHVGRLPTSEARAPNLEKLAAALGGHWHSVEHGTNKALRAVLPDGLPEHVLAVYRSVARSLARVIEPSESDPDFQQRYTELAAAVSAMCSMEHSVVVPTLYRSLGQPALVQVAFDVERRFEEAVGADALADVAGARLLDEPGRTGAAAATDHGS